MTTRTKRGRRVVRTADVIATYRGTIDRFRGKLVMIERLKEPAGIACPGGHVDPGERPRQTAFREFKEETGLTLHGGTFLTERKGKRRDPRYAMSKTRVYVGIATGTPRDEEGFTKVLFLDPRKVRALPKERFAFDHASVLKTYFKRGR